MKFAAFVLPCLFLAHQCGAFVVVGPSASTAAVARPSSLGMAIVELDPELEGGEEMTPKSSMPGCRMKKMEALPDLKSDDGPVYNFWMQAETDAALIKEYRTQILKDASKKANFPGFRKGQVPPYALPQIAQFAIQESVVKTVEAVVEAFGCKSLAGSDGEVNVNEDVAAMAKGYKNGDSLSFTATVKLALPATSVSEEAVEAVEAVADALDAEVVTEK